MHIERAHCFWYHDKRDLANQELDSVENLLTKIDNQSQEYMRIKANYLHLRAISSPFEDYSQTLGLLLQSISLKKKINAKSDLALSYNNLGYYLWLKNDFDAAIVNLKLSLEINLEIENEEQIALNYINLVQVSVAKDDMDSANEYMQAFEKIYRKNTENIMINRYYYYSLALVLSRSNNLRQKLEAEDIFETLINSEFVSFSIYTKAIFNLCILYLFQLRVSYDESIFEKLNARIDQLYNYGLETDNQLTVLKTEFLQAKILAYKREWENAKLMFTKINEDAIRLEDPKMAILVENELETIFKLEKLLHKSDFEQNIEEFDLQEHLLNFVSNKLPKVEEIREKPVSFLILTEDGNQIHAIQLDSSVEFNSYLFASFISAISSFVGQVFGVKSRGLERINHENYTILLRRKEDLYYCYIYEGETNTGITKMSTIIAEIHDLIDTSDVVICLRPETIQNIEDKIKEILR